jgi:hypothetical protein
MLCAHKAKFKFAPRYSVVLSGWPKTNFNFGEEATRPTRKLPLPFVFNLTAEFPPSFKLRTSLYTLDR